MINVTQGFNVKSNEILDNRTVLSKANMFSVGAEPGHRHAGRKEGKEIIIPNHQLVVCSDDNKLYIFSDSETYRDPEVGYFRLASDAVDEVQLEDNPGVSLVTKVGLINVATIPLARDGNSGIIKADFDGIDGIKIDEGVISINPASGDELKTFEGIKPITPSNIKEAVHHALGSDEAPLYSDEEKENAMKTLGVRDEFDRVDAEIEELKEVTEHKQNTLVTPEGSHITLTPVDPHDPYTEIEIRSVDWEHTLYRSELDKHAEGEVLPGHNIFLDEDGKPTTVGKLPHIPFKVGELENDANFAKTEEVLELVEDAKEELNERIEAEKEARIEGDEILDDKKEDKFYQNDPDHPDHLLDWRLIDGLYHDGGVKDVHTLAHTGDYNDINDDTMPRLIVSPVAGTGKSDFYRVKGDIKVYDLLSGTDLQEILVQPEEKPGVNISLENILKDGGGHDYLTGVFTSPEAEGTAGTSSARQYIVIDGVHQPDPSNVRWKVDWGKILTNPQVVDWDYIFINNEPNWSDILKDDDLSNNVTIRRLQLAIDAQDPKIDRIDRLITDLEPRVRTNEINIEHLQEDVTHIHGDIKDLRDHDDVQDLKISKNEADIATKQEKLISGVNIRKLQVDGVRYDLLAAPYDEPVEFETGKIDVVKRNGIALPIINKEVNINVPEKVSQLENDKLYVETPDFARVLQNYYDSADVDRLLNDKQDNLLSSINIKTINGQSIVGPGNLIVDSGVKNYNDLVYSSLPKINGITLQGDRSLASLGIVDTQYTAGDNVQISAANVISATDTKYEVDPNGLRLEYIGPDKWKITNTITKTSQLTNDGDGTGNPYLTRSEGGAKSELEFDNKYNLKVLNYTLDGQLVHTSQPVNLPLESMVVHGTYNAATKSITLELKNGDELDIPVSDIIGGLENTNNKVTTIVEDLTNTTYPTTNAVYQAIKDSVQKAVENGAGIKIEGPDKQLNWQYDNDTLKLNAAGKAYVNIKGGHGIEVAKNASNVYEVRTRYITAEIPASAWVYDATNVCFKAAVTVSGMTTSSNPIVDVNASAVSTQAANQIDAWGEIYRASATNNAITFYSNVKPTINVPIQVQLY